MDDIEFKEGFLCPICVKDLGTIAELTAHFDSAHSAEDKDVLQSLKGFLGRAKRKLLKDKDGSKGDEDELGATSERLHRLSWEPQALGVTQRHTENFRKIRSLRVDRYVSQTNKLLLRLGKLITDAPSDPEKRKEHEKSLVPWVEDADVRLCPGCAKSFNLSRRRHHCRLCGAIMCQVCSQFLDFNFARKLINPISGSPVLATQTAQQASRSPLVRRGSISSLASVMSPTGDPHLRLCRDCLVLLNRRDRQIEQKNLQPIIVQMYQRMKGFMEEAEGLIPEYCKMVDSLQEGQSDYSLEEVQTLRVKLTKIAENVDLISRKIGILGTQDGGTDGSGPSPRALQLQGCVRLAASHFLRHNMLGLPAPPSKEELLRLQGARREQMQQRIQREKAAAMEAQQRQSNHTPPSVQKLPLKPTHATDHNTSPPAPASAADSGWSPANVVSGWGASAVEEPMVQQMNIIRGYIRQARAARRMDEVAMLEANLKELKQEYLRMTMKDA